MGKIRGRYAKTTAWRKMKIGRCTYKFRTCCAMCAEAIRANPGRYVDLKKAKSCVKHLSMRHRTTRKVVQKAVLVTGRPKTRRKLSR